MNKDNLKEILLQSVLQEDNQVWHPSEYKFFGPSTRALNFSSEVISETITPLISQILELEQMDPEEPIYLYLNTEGGSLTDGLALYDTIKNVSCPVIVIVTGLCASAGLVILSAADYAMATSNSVFFYHQPIISPGPINSVSDMQSLSSHYDYCSTVADDILKKKTKMKKTIWNNNFKDKTSFYFDADKALEFNLIDSLVKSRKVKFKIERG